MSRSSSDGETDRCRKASSIRFIPRLEGRSSLRAPRIKRGRRAAPATLSARLGGHVTLRARSDGEIVARFDAQAVGLVKFSAAVAARAEDLGMGLLLVSFGSDVRRLDARIR